MSNNYRDRVLQDHPSGYWPFDESAGTRVSNIQNEAYDAAIWAGSFARDVSGPEHTGITGTRVGTSNGVGVSGLPVDNHTFSLSFWYREAGPRTAWTVLTHGIDWGNQGWALQRNDASNHVYIYIESSEGTSSIGFNSSNNVLDGAWHHIAIVLNHGSGSLFVDGVEVAAGGYAQGDGIGHSAFNLVEWITTENAQREIAEYALWLGVALSAEQIQAHVASAYDSSSAEPVTPGTPGGLVASGAEGAGQINVQWQEVAGSEQYVLQRRLVSSNPPVRSDRGNESSEDLRNYSIQELVNAASPGDTVQIPEGIYRETVIIDKPLTLSGAPGAEIRGSDNWSNDHWSEVNGRFRSSRSAFQNNREGMDQFPGGHFPGGPDREEYCRVWIDGNKLSYVTAEPGPGEFALDSERRVVLGAGIDPANVGLIEVAQRRRWIEVRSNDVTIEGITCQHAANGPFSGALQSHSNTNVTIRHSALRHAHGLNVYLTGGDVSGRNNRIHNCEISYAGCIGLHAASFHELEVSENSIHHNNAVGFHRHWHAGGVKFYAVQNVAFTGNHLYENNAVGVWFDGPCRHNQIAYNRVHNDYIGIYYEVSRDGVIHDNVVHDCTENGIYVGNSRDTVIRNNVVAWNHRGISIFVRDRSGEPYDVGPAAGTHGGIHVYENSIFYSGSAALGNRAAISWQDSPPDWTFGSDNWGWDNRYWVEQTSPSDSPYRWRQDSYRDVAAFASTPAETTASYMSRNERDSILSQHNIHRGDGNPV